MKDSDKQQPSQLWQDLQAKLKELCNEQERIYKPQFENIFSVLYEIDEGQREIYNTNGWNTRDTLPDKADEGLIAKAIKKAGFAKKKTIADGFLRYANIVIEGKRLQIEMALQNAKELEPPQQTVVGGWGFKPAVTIIAPVGLHETINRVVANEALKGLFDSVTDINGESIDELIDELLMAEAFNVRCSLTHYTEELTQYNVISGQNSFFDRDFTRLLLATLKEAVLNLKEYTDKPNRLKKAIADIVKRFDDVKVWGIFFQILVLQGLCDMLERLDINEGESGFDEAQAFYNWVFEMLFEKEYWFASVSSIAYSDNDLLRLKPLCEYLMSTRAGRAVQEYIKQDSDTETAATGTIQPQHLSRHYNSTLTDERLKKIFDSLISNDYLAAGSDFEAWLWICTGRGKNVPTEPLKWIGRQNTQAEFAAWICGAKNTTDWETTAACFILSNGSNPNINAMKQHKISDKEKTKLLNLLKTAAQ